MNEDRRLETKVNELQDQIKQIDRKLHMTMDALAKMIVTQMSPKSVEGLEEYLAGKLKEMSKKTH